MHAISKLRIFAGLVILALVLSACGGGSNDARPTRVPTKIPPTPTQRSTPLPDVPSAPALGQGSREIVIQFVLPGETPSTDARRFATQLQGQLAEQLQLAFKVELVTENEALKNLCSGAPTAAWVSAYSYGLAQARCNATPVLAVKRGRAPNMSIGTTAEIIARSDFTALRQLSDQVFCRSNEQDPFTSWIYPGLMLASQGVDPMLDLSAVRDYPDDLEMGKALYQEWCAAAALPPDEYEDLLIDLAGFLSTDRNPITTSELTSRIKVISPAGTTTAPASQTNWRGFDTGVIPYEVLVFPPNSTIPAELREAITDVITDFFEDQADGSQRLNELLNKATGIMSVNANHYSAFRTMITNAKWDMAFDQ
ncbi:MAG: PhnD/SsuA/transferrin family substrate-binding protein [Chloroflexi bacterium]|nr:PhnD/SsuA/transferrin family substrate-binding protein [Chloroflexota bacterium]